MSERPAVVQPMLPTLAKYPFSNPQWLFEPKWDGYRAICFVEDDAIRFSSKNRKNLTERFPELQGIAKSIKAKSAVLDGEIVALDRAGVPCFDGLRSRKHSEQCVVAYYAFDLLHLDGRDLRLIPLLLRKTQLKRLLPKPTFYADLTQPQSLNKYQYCLNNPLVYSDPNGTYPLKWTHH